MKRLKMTLLTVILAATIGGNAMAADYRNNPFTLTYDHAITENVAGKVQIHPVRYEQKIPRHRSRPPEWRRKRASGRLVRPKICRTGLRYHRF